MTPPSLRIATRGSALARWQAEHIAGLLRGEGVPSVELVIVETLADRRLDLPIDAMGGKGVFVKEVQAAVLDGRADLAVHSAKDLPSTIAPGLCLGAVTERADPRDVVVGARFADLVAGRHVATGSVRRRSQLAYTRPGLMFSQLRGNIATRLRQLDRFDAIVMAKAALDRLEPALRAEGLWPSVVDVLDVAVMTPQVGQGALAVECRADDAASVARLARIEHSITRRAVDAERAFLAELGGDCTIPAGAHAVIVDDQVQITGVLCSADRPVLARETRVGRDSELVGRLVARNLVEALANVDGGHRPCA